MGVRSCYRHDSTKTFSCRSAACRGPVPWIAFHLHSSCSWLVDVVLDVDGTNVVEMGDDANVVGLEKVIPIWKKIQEKKPCIVYRDATPEELERILGELSPVGLSVQTFASTLADAVANREVVYEQADELCQE